MTDIAPRSLARSSTLMFFALVVAGGFSILISMSVARFLTTREFGIYSIIVNMQTVVALLASLGMGTALAKFVAEFKQRDPLKAVKLVRIGLTLMLILSAICLTAYLALGGVIGRNLYREPDIVDLVPFSALVAVSSALFTTVYGIGQGCQNFGLLVAMQIATPIVTLGLVLLLVPAIGIEGALLGYFLSQTALAIGALYIIHKRELPFKGVMSARTEYQLVKKLVSLAVPVALSTLLVGPVIWIATTELALVSGFEAMGFFAVAMVLFQAFTIVPRAIVIPLIPRVSELTNISLAEVRSTVVKSVRTTSFVMFPILFAVGLFAEPIVRTLYGSSYIPATDVVFLMMATCYLSALTSIVGGMIAGIGRMWTGLALNLLWAFAFLFLTFIMIPLWGLEGFGYAFVLSYGFHTMITFVVSRKLFEVDLRNSLDIVVLGVAMFALGCGTTLNGSINYFSRTGMLVAATALVSIVGRDILSSIMLRIKSVRRDA